MNKDKRMFLVQAIYRSAASRYFVFETRKDARDYRNLLNKRKKILHVLIIPASRGPSNVGAR